MTHSNYPHNPSEFPTSVYRKGTPRRDPEKPDYPPQPISEPLCKEMLAQADRFQYGFERELSFMLSANFVTCRVADTLWELHRSGFVLMPRESQRLLWEARWRLKRKYTEKARQELARDGEKPPTCSLTEIEDCIGAESPLLRFSDDPLGGETGSGLSSACGKSAN